MSDLQSMGRKALASAPQPLQRALDGLNVQFTPRSGTVYSASRGGAPTTTAIAGVAPNDPNRIQVMDQKAFANPRYAAHEATHLWQNNLPPSIQKAIPPDNPNPEETYNYGGDEKIAQMAKQGQSILSLPREQQSAVMEEYTDRGGDKAPRAVQNTYGKIAKTIDDVPLSQIEMTQPDATELNMHPRAPRPPVLMPVEAPGAKAAPSDDMPPGWSATPPSGGGDDIPAGWSTTPPKTDNRNGLQRAFDSAVSTPSAYGPRWLDTMGRRAAATLTPAFHPVDALSSAFGGPVDVKGEKSVLGNMAHGLGDEYKQYGAAGVAGNVLGSVLGAEVTGGALRGALRGGGAMLRRGAAAADNAVIGTGSGDVAHGANPGRALSSNRIWGSNSSSLMSGVNNEIPKVALENRTALANAPANVKVNSGPLVSQPFDEVVGAATDPKTGAAAPAQVAKARKMQNSLAHVLDDNTGQVTPNMRDPNLTPLEAAQLKSNIYGMTDYDNPSRSALANRGLKGAAHNLKVGIEQAVPESVESGQRLHDLMSAKDILHPQANGTKLIPASKSGVIDRAVTAGVTGGAALADAAGSGANQLSRFVKAPLLVPALVGKKDRK